MRSRAELVTADRPKPSEVRLGLEILSRRRLSLSLLRKVLRRLARCELRPVSEVGVLRPPRTPVSGDVPMLSLLPH